MAKPGKHKAKYDKYKNSGHLEANKKARAERHKKRMARFAKRREEGKSYEYKPNPYPKGTKDFEWEAYIRSHKNVDHRTEPQRLRSIFAKLENELIREEKLMKKEKAGLSTNGKEKTRQRPPRGDYEDME